MTARDLAEAGAVPGVHWHVLGEVGCRVPHVSMFVAGTVSDPWRHLCSADVVVAAAGDAAIADVAAARAPLVAVPQERPFHEQVKHVRLLAAQELCVSAEPWPARGEWEGLLASALARGGDRWAEVSDGLGAQRAATLLSELAASSRGSHVA
jgi:hypothetical protein